MTRKEFTEQALKDWIDKEKARRDLLAPDKIIKHFTDEEYKKC